MRENRFRVGNIVKVSNPDKNLEYQRDPIGSVGKITAIEACISEEEYKEGTQAIIEIDDGWWYYPRELSKVAETGKDWFCYINDRLRDYSEGDVWSLGDEIMCRTESAANAIADLLTQLYSAQGEEVTINTGYYDHKEDERNGETDRCTGWHYVNIG